MKPWRARYRWWLLVACLALLVVVGWWMPVEAFVSPSGRTRLSLLMARTSSAMVGVLLDRWRVASSPNEAENQAEAVAAGVANHVWTSADLVAMMERLEEKDRHHD